jgi:hypothetical protein
MYSKRYKGGDSCSIKTLTVLFNDARLSLLKMKSDYTVEFIWIMSSYKSCSHDDIERILHTPTIKRLISKHQNRNSLVSGHYQDPLTLPPALLRRQDHYVRPPSFEQSAVAR